MDPWTKEQLEKIESMKKQLQSLREQIDSHIGDELMELDAPSNDKLNGG